MKKYLIIIIVIIIAFSYFIFHKNLNDFAQNSGEEYYSKRIKNKKNNPKVYDIMHKYLPNLNKYEMVNNVMLLLTLIPLIYTNDISLYFDFVLLILVINIIRDVTINLTILPKDKDCLLEKYSEVYSSLAGACYDKIFSGHFAFVFLLTILFYHNSIITNIPLLVGWNLLNSFFIISTRLHYTIDILMSFFVTFFIYSQYKNLGLNMNTILDFLNKL